MTPTTRWCAAAATSGVPSAGRRLPEGQRSRVHAFGPGRRKPAALVLAAAGAYLVRRGATGHCDVYQALDLDTSTSAGDTRRALGGGAGIHVDEAIVVNRGISELYAFWRDLENLPRFMPHLESVEQLTDTLSRWRARGPGSDLKKLKCSFSHSNFSGRL